MHRMLQSVIDTIFGLAHLIDVICVRRHPGILVQCNWEWLLLFQLINGRNLRIVLENEVGLHGGIQDVAFLPVEPVAGTNLSSAAEWIHLQMDCRLALAEPQLAH